GPRPGWPLRLPATPFPFARQADFRPTEPSPPPLERLKKTQCPKSSTFKEKQICSKKLQGSDLRR
ncbi:hypothetical protein, partial [Corynebacterium sp. ACRQJ]|uniref:hypothetical protein n=1 Tax=Corynebacterium sp. ACRQJ TaxID=2918189 RepID=UPI001EF3F24D